MPFPKISARKAVKKASKKRLKSPKDKKLFNSAAKALIGASKKGMTTVPGRARGPGDSEDNDQTLILASPGEGIVPRSMMQRADIKRIFDQLPKMAEGGTVPGDEMGEFLDKFETEDEYAKRSMKESKKYKKAKKGDPGVVDVGFDEEGNAQIPVPKMADGGEVPNSQDIMLEQLISGQSSSDSADTLPRFRSVPDNLVRMWLNRQNPRDKASDDVHSRDLMRHFGMEDPSDRRRLPDRGPPKMADGGEVPQQDPGLIAAIRSWLSAQRGDPNASKEVAEQMNKALPRAISGREAVERKRAQYKQIDELGKE